MCVLFIIFLNIFETLAKISIKIAIFAEKSANIQTLLFFDKIWLFLTLSKHKKLIIRKLNEEIRLDNIDN